MTALANMSKGAINAVNSAFKARRSMNDSLSRLSTGIRTLHGNDPAGQAVASNITTQARSADIAARNGYALVMTSRIKPVTTRAKVF